MKSSEHATNIARKSVVRSIKNKEQLIENYLYNDDADDEDAMHSQLLKEDQKVQRTKGTCNFKQLPTTKRNRHRD